MRDSVTNAGKLRDRIEATIIILGVVSTPSAGLAVITSMLITYKYPVLHIFLPFIFTVSALINVLFGVWFLVILFRIIVWLEAPINITHEIKLTGVKKGGKRVSSLIRFDKEWVEEDE